MFTSIEQRVHRVHVDSNWHKQVPPKVSLFVGHLFRNQLPTKNNISRQGIIQAVANVYARGCALQEYVDHLFICWSYFGQLWLLLRNWLSFSSVDTFRVQHHFVQFGQLCGFPHSTLSFLKLIWFSCVWTIWKERNNMIFNNKAFDLHQLLDKVRLLSFMSLKAKIINFAFDYYKWWRHPLSCMVITLFVLLFLQWVCFCCFGITDVVLTFCGPL